MFWFEGFSRVGQAILRVDCQVDQHTPNPRPRTEDPHEISPLATQHSGDHHLVSCTKRECNLQIWLAVCNETSCRVQASPPVNAERRLITRTGLGFECDHRFPAVRVQPSDA